MAEEREQTSSITHIDKGSLKRTLKVGDLFAVGYGDLGSSIYYALGITALYALGATPIALALAGLVFVCTALTYAEMSSTIKDSVGSASYSRHAFNDLISFIAGWGLLLDYIVTIAISSYAIGPYLAFFFPFLKIISYKIILSVGLIGVLFVINFFGTKHSSRMSWALTTLTLCTQIVIIVIGAIWFLNVPELFSHMKINAPDSMWSPSWPDFWKGTAMAMVAYTGIESMAALGSEAKRPEKTVPRAILYAMVMLLFVYFGISIVALSAMTPQELGTTFLDDPVAGIVAKLPFGGKLLGAWVGMLAAIILFVAANAGLMGSSRLAFKMGENYQLPRFIYKLHPRFKTPFVSLATFGVLAALIILWSRGNLVFLADLYTFGAMMAFCAAHLSLIMLRVKKPNLHRPFRVPLNLKFKNFSLPITAMLGGLLTFGVWILVIITKPEGRSLGFTWIALGLIMYFIYRRKHKIAPTGTLEIKKIKIPGYQAKSYKKILVPTRGGKETQTVQMACEIAKVHKGEVTAINIIEVPFSVSIDSPLHYRTVVAESVLKRAEAIGREFNVTMGLRVIKSRSISQAILELIEQEEYDLLVLGAVITPSGSTKGFGAVTDDILRDSTCPVLVCYNHQ